MRQSLTVWGITEPEVLALEAKYGPSLASFSAEERIQIFTLACVSAGNPQSREAVHKEIGILFGRDFAFYDALGKALFQS